MNHLQAWQQHGEEGLRHSRGEGAVVQRGHARPLHLLAGSVDLLLKGLLILRLFALDLALDLLDGARRRLLHLGLSGLGPLAPITSALGTGTATASTLRHGR